METRLEEVISRVTTELEKIESRRVDLRNMVGTLTYIFHGTPETAIGRPKGKKPKRVLSADARERIANAQRERWAKTKRKKKANGHDRASNSTSPQWSEKDDAVIVGALKSKGEPQDAPNFARSLVKRLSGRTEGAIRQRIGRLAKEGVLKQYLNGKGEHGGVPHMMVEAG